MAFDGQIVRFRGRLEFEFEGSAVDDSACGLPVFHSRIWWQYGGEGVIALSSKAKHIQSTTSPVLKDAQFELFQKFVHPRRSRRPDGEDCHNHHECAYYEVVATYTGRYFATTISNEPEPPSDRFRRGCCDQLVIEQVAAVEAQPTSEGQTFSCSSTSWQTEYPAVRISSFDERVTANRGHGR
jgi:hypothetical protein